MTTFTETITEKFTVVACYSCGARFGIGSGLYRRAVTDAQGTIHCPACGKESCWNESESSRLRKQLEARDRELREQKCEVLRQKQMVEIEHKNFERAAKRLRRVQNGVCPCCNRTFSNLARHMATKHGK